MSEAHAHYQTMSNMELIALLLQQEIDAERQRAESELQATLLEKREAELKKLKVQVRDLEDYIDKLLVRIMEQTPTLLQVRGRPKWCVLYLCDILHPFAILKTVSVFSHSPIYS